MEDEVKLHLGCGTVYKPGFVNVDLRADSVADVVADVMRLPFPDGSVDRIEAFQVLEHFDLVHSRYVLAEWSRALAEDGTLVIETPDVEQTLEKFVRSDLKSQERTLQWVFGIDSPGLAHKTGFTRDILASALKEAGFDSIRWRKQETHGYEEGMRVECGRHRANRKALFASRFRGRIVTLCDHFDSYALIPMEEAIRRALDKVPDEGFPSADDVVEAVAILAVRHPCLATAFVTALADLRLTDEDGFTSVMASVRSLSGRRIHERAFSAWMSSLKEGAIDAQFKGFMRTLEEDVKQAMITDPETLTGLSYIMHKEPAEIIALELELVLAESSRHLGAGIREFSLGAPEEAVRHLRIAVAINPFDFLAQWNLGRALVAKGADQRSARDALEKALVAADNRSDRRAIAEELKSCEKGTLDSIPRKPVVQ
jgi:predicted SAM-dependent methyltransferase